MQLIIREAAILALRGCLVLIAKRATKQRTQRYYRVFLEVQQSFKGKAPEAIHGALLTIGPSVVCSQFAQFVAVASRSLA